MERACSKDLPELFASLPFVSQGAQMLYQFRKCFLTLGVPELYLSDMEVSLFPWENALRMAV